jgi:hypothetical protein
LRIRGFSHSIIFVLLLTILFSNLEVRAELDESWVIPGDHYEWLLDSPYRQYLSGAAENFLTLRYGEGGTLPGLREESHSAIRGYNLIVNDRTQDENPSTTTQSEAAIAVHKNNVVVGWNDIGQFSDTGSLIGYGFSLDGGTTFVDGGVIYPVENGANLGDPDIAADRNGNFYFSMISFDANGIGFIGISKSGDGGRTFSAPVSASTIVSGPDSFQDKELIAVDTTGGQFDGNIYVAWTRFGPDGPQIMFSRSTNAGRTFQNPIAISTLGSFTQGATPRVGPNGEIYIVWERFNTPGIHISKSTDGGRTFGADAVAETLVADLEFIGQPASPNTCEGRQILNGYVDAAFEFPAMFVNPTNGEVYVTFNSNPSGVDESDVFFTRSADGGSTWSSAIRLNDDSTISDQFMPAMTVAPDGTIGVTWYDRRLDPRNEKFDLYLGVSNDGGRTWFPNKRVSTVSSEVPPLGPNFDRLRPCYMGDYNDITADGDQFYIAWGDNRERGRTWTTQEEMPTPRESTINVALGQAVFVIGGQKLGFGEKGEARNNEIFNTRTGRWKSLAPIPTARSFAAGASAGMSIYVGGGQVSKHGGVSDSLERYDALLNRWVQLPPLPTARQGLGAARIDNQIYLIGGQSCISPFCGETLDIVEVYDINSRKWSEAASLPEPRAGFATVVINDKIYVVGGYSTEGVHSQFIRGYGTILEYSPSTDIWRPIASLDVARISPIAGACGDKLIISGGLNPNTFNLIRRNAWAFDTALASWEQIAAPKHDRAGIEAVTVNNRVYAMGGSTNSRVPQDGVTEFFECATLGSDRADPDIFVAMESLSAYRTTSTTSTQSLIEVRQLRNSANSSIIFRLANKTLKNVRVNIYNLNGVEVFDSGESDSPLIQWNLNTKDGRLAAIGVYFYRVSARDRAGKWIQSSIRKILVMR